MKIKKQLRIPAFSIPLWWPDLPGDWRAWLPSRGNVLITLVMIAVLLWAQSAGAVSLLAPRNSQLASTGTIAYQGRLADSSGNPLTSTLNMSFRLYSAATGGAPLWTEQWTGSNGVKVSDGLFNVMLGSLTPIAQSVITGNSNLFLGITVGTDDEMSPRVQLGSVPFAVQALSVPDGSITAEKIADGAVTQAKLAQGFYRETVFTLILPNNAGTTSSTTVPFGTIEILEESDLHIAGTWILQNNTSPLGFIATLEVDGIPLKVYGGEGHGDVIPLSSAGIASTVARYYYLPKVAAGIHTFGIKIEQMPFRSNESIHVVKGSTMWIRTVPVQ